MQSPKIQQVSSKVHRSSCQNNLLQLENGNGICRRNCHGPILFLHLWILFLEYTHTSQYTSVYNVYLQYIYTPTSPPFFLASSISHLPRLSLTGLKELRDTAGTTRARADHRPSIGAEASRRNGGYAVMPLTTAVVLG